MRTTLTIEDDLALELAQAARDSHKPFKVVVNDALRRGLSDTPVAEPEFRIKSHAGGLKPGIDARGLNELAWEPDIHR